MSGFSSDYLNTRVSLYASRLFPAQRLLDLIDLDLNQVLQEMNRITGHHYETEPDKLGRNVYYLYQYALEDYRVLLRPFSGNERRFFNFAIRWFELVNVKVLIRGKFTATPVEDIKDQLVDLGYFVDLATKELLETEDPYEMLRMLEMTAYGGIVRQARRVYDEQGNDLFLLDATIDRSFFIDLKQRTRFLQPQDAERVNHVLGNLLDRFNLLWLMRYRFSYQLSPAKSYFLLTAIGKKLHSAELMRLAKIETLEELLDELPEPFHSLLSRYKVIADMEVVMEYFSLSIAARELLYSSNVAARTFSYILLREAEVRFLQAVIKGKRLGFDSDMIQQAVGGLH